MNKKIVLGAFTLLVLTLVGIGIYRQVFKKQEIAVIKIGAVLPLTGKFSDAGNTVLAGLTFATDNINKDSKKYRYEIISEDTRSEPSSAVIAYRKLIDINKIKILFTTTTSHVMSIKPQAIKDSILLFGIASHPDVIKDNNGLIFQPNNTSFEESEVIANFITKEGIKTKKILLYYYNSEFGVSFKKQIEDCLQGLEINSFPFDEDPIKLKNLLTSDVIKNKTNNVIVIGFSPSMGVLIKTLREFQYKGKIITNTGFFNPKIIDAAGEASNGVYYVDYNFPYNSMKNMDSLALIRYKVHFSALSYIAYYSLKLINQAINQTSIDNKHIAKYLKSIGKGSIDSIAFTSFSDGSIKPELVMKELIK